MVIYWSLHVYMLEEGTEFPSAKQTLAEKWNQQIQTENTAQPFNSECNWTHQNMKWIFHYLVILNWI